MQRTNAVRAKAVEWNKKILESTRAINLELQAMGMSRRGGDEGKDFLSKETAKEEIRKMREEGEMEIQQLQANAARRRLTRPGRRRKSSISSGGMNCGRRMAQWKSAITGGLKAEADIKKIRENMWKSEKALNDKADADIDLRERARLKTAMEMEEELREDVRKMQAAGLADRARLAGDEVAVARAAADQALRLDKAALDQKVKLMRAAGASEKEMAGEVLKAKSLMEENWNRDVNSGEGGREETAGQSHRGQAGDERTLRRAGQGDQGCDRHARSEGHG